MLARRQDEAAGGIGLYYLPDEAVGAAMPGGTAVVIVSGTRQSSTVEHIL